MFIILKMILKIWKLKKSRLGGLIKGTKIFKKNYKKFFKNYKKLMEKLK
jgi:hypothetical protein